MPTQESSEDAFRQRRMAESFGVDAERYDRTRPNYPDELIEWVVASLPDLTPATSSERPDGAAGAGSSAPAAQVPAGHVSAGHVSAAQVSSGHVSAAQVSSGQVRGAHALGAHALGAQLLDVGIGTGIVARQFRAAGCRVAGVEPDPRMAAFARIDGFDVDVATFEQWDAAGRSFDAVVAGQAWHWVDPVAGAAKAASVLRPGGRLALFWNAGQPSPPAAEAFAEVFDRLMPGSRPAQAYRAGVSAAQGYATFLDRAEDAFRATGAFAAPERWSFERDRVYSRDEWLDLLPTQGLFTTLPPDELAALSAATGAAVDALGGRFAMRFTTLATAATRLSTSDSPRAR